MYLFTIIFFLFLGHAQDECTCPVIKCDPCYVKTTVGKESKLCLKQGLILCEKFICEKEANYEGCLLQYKTGLPKKNEPKKFAVDLPTLLPEEEEKKEPSPLQGIKRTLSSVIQKLQLVDEDTKSELVPIANQEQELLFPEISNEVVGKVIEVSGDVKIYQNKKEEKLTKSARILTASQLTNSSANPVTISLDYRNTQKAKIKINSKSKIQFLNNPEWLAAYGIPFEVIYGGVEVEVEDQLEKPLSVKAKELMIFSKHGKFKVDFETINEKLSVKVTALEGEVSLENRLYPANRRAILTAGTYSQWYSEGEVNILSDEERKDIEIGYLTPVFKLSEEDLVNTGIKTKTKAKDLKRNIDEKVSVRKLATSGESDFLCSSPQAKFQQCSWTCEGNAAGASKCQAHLPQVSCVRRMCNASGEWASSTVFSSNFEDLCPSSGSRVGSCEP